MNGRKAFVAKTAGSGGDAGAEHVAHKHRSVPAGTGLVGHHRRGRGYLDWDSGLALLAGSAMVKKTQRNKMGRPANSSDVRLTPEFRNPLDIERLGKALVSIALKQTVELDTDGDNCNVEADNATQ